MARFHGKVHMIGLAAHRLQRYVGDSTVCWRYAHIYPTCLGMERRQQEPADGCGVWCGVWCGGGGTGALEWVSNRAGCYAIDSLKSAAGRREYGLKPSLRTYSSRAGGVSCSAVGASAACAGACCAGQTKLCHPGPGVATRYLLE